MSENLELKILENAFDDFGIEYDELTIQRFARYMELVLEWNKKVNLTAIVEPEAFITKHFIDSVSCAADDYFKAANTVIDVGTGAGFPGMPLAIIAQDKEFLLADSLNKRIKVLNEVVSELGLKNIQLVHGRAEELARRREYREKYDICVSRAVSQLRILSEYCLPFVKKGGTFAAYKSSDSDDEIKNAEKSIHTLGGKLEYISDRNMPKYGLFHRIIYINKEKNTPKQYPRKPGTPEKYPL